MSLTKTGLGRLAGSIFHGLLSTLKVAEHQKQWPVCVVVSQAMLQDGNFYIVLVMVTLLAIHEYG